MKTNISWFGEIPDGWEIKKIKTLFYISKDKNDGSQKTVLSLTQKGLRIRDITTNEGQLAASYDNYTLVKKNDIVMNPMDLVTGFVDLSPYEGVISTGYKVLRKLPKVDVDLRYILYFLQWYYYDKIMFPFGLGVSPDHRWTLKAEALLNFSILIPQRDIQTKIVRYLDSKIVLIDKTIDKIGYEGSLLKSS